jgi:hypothetical protein
MGQQPEPGHLHLLVCDDKVVQHGMPGFPLASALIDLSHDRTEGAGNREGDRHGQ